MAMTPTPEQIAAMEWEDEVPMPYPASDDQTRARIDWQLQAFNLCPLFSGRVSRAIVY